MRWGVGKGRFRNLTATILCVFLALSFGAVWTFFRRIEPLTIDTSQRSQTASIGDRLINTQSQDTSTLSQTQIVLFCRIADSVDAMLHRQFATPGQHSAKWASDTLPEQLRSLQVQTRKTIAFMLNQNYTSIAEYRHTERVVLKVLVHDEREEQGLHALCSTPLVKSLLVHNTREDSLSISASERELVQEFSASLHHRLLAFRLGLSSDTLHYPEYAHALRSQGGSK